MEDVFLFSLFCTGSYKILSGLTSWIGWRATTSSPCMRYWYCSGVISSASSFVRGQLNAPSSSLLYKSRKPSPSAEQEQDIFLIRIQLKIKLDDGCKAFHTTSQICVTGSQVDPAKPRSIIQHERSLRSVTGVLLKRNWISLQKPILSG